MNMQNLKSNYLLATLTLIVFHCMVSLYHASCAYLPKIDSVDYITVLCLSSLETLLTLEDIHLNK